MRNRSASLLLALLLLPFCRVVAGHFQDSARVLSVTPVLETVPYDITREVCREPVGDAAIAASIGRDIRQQQRRWSPAQRCRTIREEGYRQRIDGYRVSYRYAGHRGSIYLDHDPGAWLPVRVLVATD